MDKYELKEQEISVALKAISSVWFAHLFWERYFNGGLVEHWIVIFEFVYDVVTTSEKALPSLDLLEKGYFANTAQ